MKVFDYAHYQPVATKSVFKKALTATIDLIIGMLVAFLVLFMLAGFLYIFA